MSSRPAQGQTAGISQAYELHTITPTTSRCWFMATVVHTARCEEVLLDGGRALQAKAKTHTKVSHAFPFPVQGDIAVRNARRQHEPEIIAGDGASRRARRRRRRCLRPTTCQPASTALHIAGCSYQARGCCIDLSYPQPKFADRQPRADFRSVELCCSLRML